MENPNYAEIVSKAAKVLDSKIPLWYRRINRSTLCMHDSELCICGQIPEIEYSSLDSSMGFSLPLVGVFDKNRGEQWDNLTKFWLAEINSRLEADKAKSADAFLARTNEIINLPASTGEIQEVVR